MRLSTPEDDDSDRDDFGRCPHCSVDLSQLSDADFEPAEDDECKDVASAVCPECQKTFAIVRTSRFHTAKFKEPT